MKSNDIINQLREELNETTHILYPIFNKPNVKMAYIGNHKRGITIGKSKKKNIANVLGSSLDSMDWNHWPNEDN